MQMRKIVTSILLTHYEDLLCPVPQLFRIDAIQVDAQLAEERLNLRTLEGRRAYT